MKGTVQNVNDLLMKVCADIMWDGIPRTNEEIAKEVMIRNPQTFGVFPLDLVAQNIYSRVTMRAVSVKMMSCKDGKYWITEEQKRMGEHPSKGGTIQ